MTHVSQSKTLVYLLSFCCFNCLVAQQTGVKGSIVDASTNDPLSEVSIRIEESSIVTKTIADGTFDFKNQELPLGTHILVFAKDGYIQKRFPIIIHEHTVLDIHTVDLEYDFNQEQLGIGIISLSDQELDESDTTTSFAISGVLQASKDIFLNAAAFDFGTTFFRPRGLSSASGNVLINGISMNKLSDGRPQWSNWGGLNTVQRHQEYTMGIAANEYTFGDLSGTTNIIMRASNYRAGASISYAASNRSYTSRMMANYSSGMTKKGWAYTVALSRRMATEGYVDGTLYDANSFCIAIEKKLHPAHSINLTSFYTPNRRGRSTAITEEVFNLRGNTYNPNWGWLNGEKKNARIKSVKQPVFMLNYYWTPTAKTTVNTNIAYQYGTSSTSRIDNGGTDLITFGNQQIHVGGGSSSDTNPIHPTQLPSFYLQNPNPTPLDFQNAHLAAQAFRTDGQLDWKRFIRANELQQQQANNSIYMLYEDTNRDIQWTCNTLLNYQFTSHSTLNASIAYTNLRSEYYAMVTDLLGGTGFLDIDRFAPDSDSAQSDLRHPNRIVQVGDRYDYNYEITAHTISGFAQMQWTYNRIDFFLGSSITNTAYQREGLYQNGYFPENSFGKGEQLTFTNYGIKAGGTLKLDGRHAITMHAAHFTKAPTLRNTYVNPRQNHLTVANILGERQASEQLQSVDVSYLLSTSKIKARLTGYYTTIQEATAINFFYTNAFSGAFVQQILTGIDTQYIGGELGIGYQITPTIQLKAAAGISQYTYTNNPTLSITSSSQGFIDTVAPTVSNGTVSTRTIGTSYLTDYKVAGGPQQASQIGITYRDPSFWWVGATANYFSNAYIAINPLSRTTNFSIDPESQLPFNEYDPEIARQLLQQEQLNPYTLVNLVGGKSWRIRQYYIGIFASITNILNQHYRTGGFEQARTTDYRSALAAAQTDTPIFGNRYFYGTGTTYFLNLSLRF